MDSIKHKMDTMIREKDAALAKAIAFEAEAKAHFQIIISTRSCDLNVKVVNLKSWSFLNFVVQTSYTS